MVDDVLNGTPDEEETEGLDGETGDGTEGLDGEAGDGTEGLDGETGEGIDGSDGENTDGTEGLDGETGDLEGMGAGIDDSFGYLGGMDGYSDGGSAETTVKDPILSNVPFVAATISVALVIGIVLGILLGKKRIKKGFDIYEG